MADQGKNSSTSQHVKLQSRSVQSYAFVRRSPIHNKVTAGVATMTTAVAALWQLAQPLCSINGILAQTVLLLKFVVNK